jgi:hypothetical protein
MSSATRYSSSEQLSLDDAFAKDVCDALNPLCDKYSTLENPPRGTPTILAVAGIAELAPRLRHIFFDQLDNTSADLAHAVIDTVNQLRGSNKA